LKFVYFHHSSYLLAKIHQTKLDALAILDEVLFNNTYNIQQICTLATINWSCTCAIQFDYSLSRFSVPRCGNEASIGLVDVIVVGGQLALACSDYGCVDVSKERCSFEELGAFEGWFTATFIEEFAEG
jgi:hypothetical protein